MSEKIRIDNLPDSVNQLSAQEFRDIIMGRKTPFEIATMDKKEPVEKIITPEPAEAPKIEISSSSLKEKIIVKSKDVPKTHVFLKDVREFTLHFTRVESFWIPGATPSKKRGYRIVSKYRFRKDAGKAVKVKGIAKGKFIRKYEESVAQAFKDQAEQFRMASAGMMPIFIEFFFVRSNQATRFDFSNIHAIITDLMQTHAWIPDDAIGNILPLPPLEGKSYIFSKDNPGCRITIMKLEPVE